MKLSVKGHLVSTTNDLFVCRRIRIGKPTAGPMSWESRNTQLANQKMVRLFNLRVESLVRAEPQFGVLVRRRYAI